MSVATEAPVKLKAKDYGSDQDVRWCPRCGDYSILSQMKKVMAKLQIPREDVVFISGIGCSSRFPYYMNTYGFHTIHGRAPTFATGLALSRPELSIWVITGDGDGLSIGGNHLIHAIRRNVNMNIILFNNRIYGLTKGQYSPTSIPGARTPSSPMGSVETPVNPICVAIAAEATFVARTIDVEVKHLTDTLERAANHRGASFVEVYQDCNVFNSGAWRYTIDKGQKEENTIFLEHDKPLIFGKEMNKGIRLKGLDPEIVTLGENGVTEDDLLVHNEQATEPSLAYLLSRMRYPEFPEPIGVFRCVENPTFSDQVDDQISQARKAKGDGDLAALIDGPETWTVE